MCGVVIMHVVAEVRVSLDMHVENMGTGEPHNRPSTPQRTRFNSITERAYVRYGHCF